MRNMAAWTDYKNHVRAENPEIAKDIDEAEAIVNLAREHNMLNSQEFLDWQDKLNAISVL